MADDLKRLLQDVQRTRGDFEARVDDLEEAKDGYYRAVSRLHDAGMPLREIAEELGLSHQRVHQMIGEAGRSKKVRKAAKAARAAGTAILCLALLAGIWMVSRPWHPDYRDQRVSDGQTDSRTRRHQASDQKPIVEVMFFEKGNLSGVARDLVRMMGRDPGMFRLKDPRPRLVD